MGGCIGSHRETTPPVSIGKNQPLKSDKPKWKSDIPLTDGQLTSKREEFWDTAPAFEGKKEIWDALKAAAFALETGDHQLAQAIVDGANITLPTGTLLDCYDELGARYQLPVYVLSLPTNLLEDGSAHTNQSSEDIAMANRGSELVIKFRFSHTQKDIKMTLRTTDTVYKVKRMIAEQEGIEPSQQKWCFGGRLLGDKLKLEDIKLLKGYLVQVIVAEPFRDTDKQPGS